MTLRARDIGRKWHQPEEALTGRGIGRKGYQQERDFDKKRSEGGGIGRKRFQLEGASASAIHV